MSGIANFLSFTLENFLPFWEETETGFLEN